MAVFLPTYFSPISQYSALWNAKGILFEIEDNFQKQSYRNRCYIYGPNGKQLLSVPVSFPNTTNRKKTKDAMVDYSESWQKQHIKSLEAAYNSSPFFDLLKNELLEIFHKKHKFLLDLNIDTFLFVKDILSLECEYETTHSYTLNLSEDYRFLADAKSRIEINQIQYPQVFSDKNGFLENLSILDLIFMEGANAISFLEKNQLTLNNPKE